MSEDQKLKIIPLGGVEEVGRNCLAIEYQNDILVVDLGLDFPDSDYPGVQYLLPDISYLKRNKYKIRGILLTHGHLDHVGGINFLLQELNFPPIFGSKLTLGIVEDRLKETDFLARANLQEIDSHKILALGKFEISFFRINHNIPGSLGLIIKTPLGAIVHSGDFKFDEHPFDQLPTEKDKLKLLGKKGVLLLLSDSTNADIKGRTLSEREVEQVIISIFNKIKGRIIFTTFSTLITRIGQVIAVCQKCRRKIVVFGFSLNKNIALAERLGYLKIPKNLFIDPKTMNQYQDKELLILSTGSQGEERAVLSRISNNEYRGIKIEKGDTIIFSSSTIPGNELAVNKMMNKFIDLGAEIIYEPILGLGAHSSGHGNADDLAEMIKLTKPHYFIPVHGEHFMQAYHRQIAEDQGMRESNIFLMKNGQVLEIDKSLNARISLSMENNPFIVETGQSLRPSSGRAQNTPFDKREIAKQFPDYIFLERNEMMENGACFVAAEIDRHRVTARVKCYGLFIDQKMLNEIKSKAENFLKKKRISTEQVADRLTDFIYSRTGKRPPTIVIQI